ncbi:regulatory protein RecX [Chloroflexota bacterium]
MGKITAICKRKGRQRQVNIFLDGKSTFSLEQETAFKERLCVGQELSAHQIQALASSDYYCRCLNAAVHYLSYRPRSESEIKDRLRQRGFNRDSIELVMVKLKEQRLVDDLAFAQFWKDNRESFSPRSQRLTQLELKQKGVAEDIIGQITKTIDDDKNAYQTASAKTRNIHLTNYHSFRRQLGEYLNRRGFSYSVINHTLDRIWQENYSGSR